jgi:tRNA-dihydrouridine synthase B
MRIGAHTLRNGLFVAPMAGITDRPFRRLARRFGAALAVSEMVSSRPELRDSRKTRLRLDHAGEPGPAKKVCNAAAGSALLSDEALVARILEAVVGAVDVPVTLKIRTGPAPERRNALRIARIAESAGVQALAVHGRTRACMFTGHAEYHTIAEVKAAVRIPVIANGDIESPEDARRVLQATGADGVMVGRAAQGRPWLFREIAHYLATGERLAPPRAHEIGAVLVEHLDGLYSLYGADHGARVARKHIGWTVRALPGGEALRSSVNQLQAADAQRAVVNDYFARLAA